MILQYFTKKETKEKKIAISSYRKILKLSNLYLFENTYVKKKDFKSSFEFISIILIMNIKLNIAKNIKNYDKINETLIEIFISDLDETLRAKGIGDMSIGKYVKSYVKKFYFRLSKLHNILDQNREQIILNYLSFINITEKDNIKQSSVLFLNMIDNIIKTYDFKKNSNET